MKLKREKKDCFCSLMRKCGQMLNSLNCYHNKMFLTLFRVILAVQSCVSWTAPGSRRLCWRFRTTPPPAAPTAAPTAPAAPGQTSERVWWSSPNWAPIGTSCLGRWERFYLQPPAAPPPPWSPPLQTLLLTPPSSSSISSSSSCVSTSSYRTFTQCHRHKWM